MEIADFGHFRENWFVCGSSNGRLGNAKEESIQKKLLENLGLAHENLILPKQVHSDRVSIIENKSQKIISDADGLITQKSGVVLGIFSADCVPLLLVEPANKIVGALHAGWRGTQKKIATKAVSLIQKNWPVDTKNLKVYLGPHIRDCCYEVGPDVARSFNEICQRVEAGKFFLSLEKALKIQLRESGVLRKNILSSDSCTCCERRFFSYRRDKSEERMISFISKVNHE